LITSTKHLTPPPTLLLSAAQLAALTAQFLAKTNDKSCDAATFDAAVEWLSESISDFYQYEQTCTGLGIAQQQTHFNETQQ